MGLKLDEMRGSDPESGENSGIRRAGGIHAHPAPEKN
jgi:hypothetical protein